MVTREYNGVATVMKQRPGCSLDAMPHTLRVREATSARDITHRSRRPFPPRVVHWGFRYKPL
eukprot:scaffold61402_cov42-Phaeocystis_antarctica.AAC.1